MLGCNKSYNYKRVSYFIEIFQVGGGEAGPRYRREN